MWRVFLGTLTFVFRVSLCEDSDGPPYWCREGHSSAAAVQQVICYQREMCLSRGEGGFVLSTRPPLSLCAGNKLSSGSNEARNCKLSGEAQWRDKGLVFASNALGDESDRAESHARIGVMIPPLLWRVMFNPPCLSIHLQILLSPLVCINILHTVFNTDLSESIFPLVWNIVSLLLWKRSFLQTEWASMWCWYWSNTLLPIDTGW